jgi:oligoribonuclease NrnB/cAMP/cGMP phosphodiesterase (DHH superfamily)
MMGSIINGLLGSRIITATSEGNLCNRGDKMKRILITHDDLDGAGCAIVFRRAYPDIEVQYHDYKTIDNVAYYLWADQEDYDKIFFADISPSEEMGLRILSNPKFVIIDHHKTRTYLEGSPDFSVDYSGTLLSYDFLCDSPYPKFIRGVNAWDMWDLQSPFRSLGEDLNQLFEFYGMKKFVEEFKNMRQITDNEKVIIEVLKKLHSDYLREKLDHGKVRIDLEDNRYLHVYIGEKRSGLGNILELDGIPDVEYLECENLNDGIVSLYSLGFDVSVIAKSLGGGGHARAAGYTI